MPFKTRRELTLQVLDVLALVSGSGVQTYTEPQIVTAIQNSFDLLFKERFWDHLCYNTTHTLDGVAGVVTDTIVGIEDFTDIKWIRLDPYEEKDTIPYFPDGNMATNTLGFTSFPWDHAQFSTKRLWINPVTTTGNIKIRARRRPDEFTDDDDIVPMDSVMLSYFVAAQLLAVDGMNPGAQSMSMGLFQDRYDTLTSNEGDHIMVAQGNGSNSFTVA